MDIHDIIPTNPIFVWSKKIFNWAKKNWVLILIFVAIILLAWQHFSFVGESAKLLKHYDEQSDSFHKQISDLEKANKEWRIEEDKLNIEHQKELGEIKAEYDAKISNINSQRVIIQTQIVKEAKTDPTSLTKKVTEVFGIPVSK